MSCYAAWNPSESDRKGSASGGVATLLARTVLQRGGVFFGTRWSSSLEAVVDWTEGDVEPFRGSRYVESVFPREARDKLHAFLKEGREVLFVGTPCQVASLLPLKKNYPRLILVDLLCHGTSPAFYLKEEIEYLGKGSRLDGLLLREGPRFRMSLWEGSRCLWARDAQKAPYLWGYLSGITLREACFKCPWARPERIGDITLGDFIGIERRNVSFVLTNSEAGEELVKECGADLEPRTLQERMAYRPGICEPSALPPERMFFLFLLRFFRFPTAIRLTMLPHRLGLPFKSVWKALHHQAHLLKTRRKK